MGILKNCYACGAPVVFEDGVAVRDCDYCGRVNTLPEAEQRPGAESGCMRRANELRNHGEYEEAARLYQRILAENPDEHEARWGLLLCRYGVQYVEDPRTKRRFATCSMVRTTSFCAEHEFREACRLAPEGVREAYEADGAYIDAAQAEIRRLSENEAAFDVFLCYKETAEDNSRTNDSILAQDLYLTLKSRGYNVFYAPVSLAGKAGYNYEAAIYHAIATAKVMLVLGTKPEYLTSTWVASEWGRFFERMDAGERKVLVPLYKDMSPEQLPEAFLARRLQAVNMGNFSFMFTLEGTLAQVFQAEKEIETVRRKSDAVAEPVRTLRKLRSVQFVPADRTDDYWPNVAPQQEISMRAHPFMMVQMMLEESYGGEGTLAAVYIIRSERGEVVRDSSVEFTMQASFVRLSMSLSLRNGNDPAFAPGRYSIELRPEGFEPYTEHFVLSDSGEDNAPVPESWLIRPVDVVAPPIREIQFVTTNTLNDLWPRAQYSRNVDMDRFEFLNFHVFMNRRLGRARTVELDYMIRNARGEEVFSYTVNVDGMANSDRYSTQLYIRKNGMPAFEPGDYTVVFRIADCAPVSAAFRLTSKKYHKTKDHTDEPTGLRGLLKKLF